MDVSTNWTRAGRREEPLSPPFRTGEVLSISRHHFHRVAYTEWGDPDSERVVLCVHGLTRQGRDFDALAAVLASQGYRVVCRVGGGRAVALPPSARSNGSCGFPASRFPV